MAAYCMALGFPTIISRVSYLMSDTTSGYHHRLLFQGEHLQELAACLNRRMSGQGAPETFRLIPYYLSREHCYRWSRRLESA
jgi:hypothetical protein